MLRLFTVDSVLWMIVHYKRSEGGGGSEGRAGPEAFFAEPRGDVCGSYGSRRGIRCAGARKAVIY